MKIKIPVHSIVDITTNSSSEIFTMETDKTKEFLTEAINSFCKENGINFKVTPYSFDDIEDDWEVKNAIEFLTEKGFSVTRKDPSKKGYVLLIDRDWQGLENLKNFLIQTFNAEVDYEG